ncbi:hypothetical protein LWI28_023149 [Acer negundo]|uniref:Uncharacterized protein n=1 Tax=Acer negundo TaxID=4023 RepID=A0AAD5J0T5_ACENE|nr:hypothetical protein LWI28_023149 [Acer negundo]
MNPDRCTQDLKSSTCSQWWQLETESNRTQSNLFDLINTFRDLSSPIQGFVGASTLHIDDGDGDGDSSMLNCGRDFGFR